MRAIVVVMATRERIIERGRRKAEKAERRFREEIGDARIAAGLSQLQASRRAGILRSTWSRIERGQRKVPSWDVAGRMAAAVGLDLVVSLHPMDAAPRDAGQLGVLADCKRSFGAGWWWRYEVPVAGGDARHWDVELTSRTDHGYVHLESETALYDIQATARRLIAKRDAGRPAPLVLIVRDTGRNRRVAKVAADVLGAEFPVSARVALEHLRRGVPPPGSAIIFIRRSKAAPSKRSTEGGA